MSRSSFFGLDIATRGLYTAQRGLTNVNHNVDNINTPGYSRQVLEQTAARPMLMVDGSGMLGTGSQVTGIKRIRDEYLDVKYRSEAQYLGEWDIKNTLLEEMQTLYNEPSDSGFNTVMNEFYNGLQQLSTDPSSHAARAAIKEKAVMLTKYFNSVASHFEYLQNDVNDIIYAKVQEVNSLADQIAQLNKQIYNFEVTGNVANDLRDQRANVVDKLSRIVNIEAYEVSYGKLPTGLEDMRFVVTISGKAIVDHYGVSHLEAVQRKEKFNSEDIENLYEIGWADGNKLTIKSGELKGYLDVRDGNDGLNGSPDFRGIPHYQKKMNEFVRVFARTFNEGIIDIDGDGILDKAPGHVDGYTLNSKDGDTPAGIRFFTMFGEDGKPMDSETFALAAGEVPADPDIEYYNAMYSKITAKNISISSEVFDNPTNNVAIMGAAEEMGNVEVLKAIMDLRHNTYMFNEGAPEDFIKTIISTMGVDGQQATHYLNNQVTMTNQIENRRQSISGVSINEEMANLVRYQHAYNAAAKMIQTHAELLEVLVNRLGI
ncbi:MAG: flagellar hook-associated protein FlgK [Clostridiaceae bacterium]|jgi:flagellar hook-associated protein 1 FlgK|nr:flagellar hook-associated protein FlgK [Clostridiaceae bacterium]